jgi:hypothetical protein
MSILKVEPSAINTNARFSFGDISTSGNIAVGNAVIQSTAEGGISFITSTGNVNLDSNTVSFLSNVSTQGLSGSNGYVGSQGVPGFTGSAGSSGTTGFTGSAAPLNLPVNTQTGAYTLTAADIGDYVNITTGGVTVPSGVFVSGDVVSIYNNSASSQTITTTAVTCYLVGTATTGNRTLAQRGLATLLCVGTNEFVISGGGLT